MGAAELALHDSDPLAAAPEDVCFPVVQHCYGQKHPTSTMSFASLELNGGTHTNRHAPCAYSGSCVNRGVAFSCARRLALHLDVMHIDGMLAQIPGELLSARAALESQDRE